MGAYPELSLKGARDVTENARKLVKKGIHPAQQKKIDRIKSVHEQANAFEAIAKQGMASSLGLGRGHQEAPFPASRRLEETYGHGFIQADGQCFGMVRQVQSACDAHDRQHSP
jgi:5-deoxy-D-glucuronate isomerase